MREGGGGGEVGADPHADFIVGVAFLGQAVGHRVDDINFEEVGRGGIGIVQGLLLDVQPTSGLSVVLQ